MWQTPFVLVGADVVVVRQVLLGHELPQHVDVAVGHLVFGEDVVIGDDDDLLAVPDLGVLAEVLLEDADGARAADVVRHEDVGIDPDVVARQTRFAPGMPGQDLLGHRHGHGVPLPQEECKCYPRSPRKIKPRGACGIDKPRGIPLS